PGIANVAGRTLQRETDGYAGRPVTVLTDRALGRIARILAGTLHAFELGWAGVRRVAARIEPPGRDHLLGLRRARPEPPDFPRTAALPVLELQGIFVPRVERDRFAALARGVRAPVVHERRAREVFHPQPRAFVGDDANIVRLGELGHDFPAPARRKTIAVDL